MPIPNPKQFKDKDSFISKCMEVEVGSGKDPNVAAGICYSVWEERMSKMSYESRVSHKIKGIYLQDLEDACQPGWRALGTKIKDGRVVPNCIPESEHPDFN